MVVVSCFINKIRKSLTFKEYYNHSSNWLLPYVILHDVIHLTSFLNPGTTNTVHWTKSEQSDAKTVIFYFLQQMFIKTKFLKKQGIIMETQQIEKVEDSIQILKIREKSEFGKNWTCVMKFQNSKKVKVFKFN